MAPPTHASVQPNREPLDAGSSATEGPEPGPPAELTLARELLRADGMTVVERHEREAAARENRSEDDAIFERAAARFRPAWTEPDAMLELGLASAVPVPEAPDEPALPQRQELGQEVPREHALRLEARDQGPVRQDAPHREARDQGPVRQDALHLDVRDQGAVHQDARTDTSRVARAGLGSLSRPLAIGAAACLAIAGTWAALAGKDTPKPAPRAAVPPALPAVPMELPTSFEPTPPPATKVDNKQPARPARAKKAKPARHAAKRPPKRQAPARPQRPHGRPAR